MIYSLYKKRLIDFFLPPVIIFFTCPILLFTWVILILQNQGKTLFHQERQRTIQAPFHIIKFKTMNNKEDKEKKLLCDNQRLPVFGKYVRKVAIDTLLRLIYVLKGFIGLIDPRLLLLKYTSLYLLKQNIRQKVELGIMGWVQVNGRNKIFGPGKLNCM